MLARVQTCWTIFQICVAERLVYRGDFAIGTLMRFLPLVTQIFLWTAIFSAANQASIRGFSQNTMIAYYLLTMLARAFSSMPNLATDLARQIREGEIKKFLIQPIDLVGYLLLTRMAHKVVYYLVAAGPFALVYYFCRHYFSGWPEAPVMGVFLASLCLAFLLSFFLETAMGLIAFWFLEVSSLLFIYLVLTFFLSGHMFPLDLLPEPWSTWIGWLPFQYMAYFPIAVFLGKIEGPEMWQGLALQAGWVAFSAILCRQLMHRGFRRYSGYGG